MLSLIKKIKHRDEAIFIVHGFSKRRWHALDPLIKHLENQGYLVYYPSIYDPLNEKDNVATQWVMRVIEKAKTIAAKHKHVYVIGFSMGGVIASVIASKIKIKRLILLAPAFEYITFENVKNKVVKTLRPKPISTDLDFIPLPFEFEKTFKDVVKENKDAIRVVHCPLLIIHGTKDSRIPLSSSYFAYEKTSSFHKQLICLEGVNHNLVEDVTYQHQIFALIESFMAKQIQE